jgi:hypothetical protein
MKTIRFDIVFSYWILLWFILYALKLTRYSPKFALILGVLENLCMLILMFFSGTKIKTMILFVFIQTIIKALPIYYLRNKPIRMKDIYFTGLIFLVFLIWLHINNESLVENQKIIYDSLLNGKNTTPLIALFVKLQKIFKNYKTELQ